MRSNRLKALRRAVLLFLPLVTGCSTAVRCYSPPFITGQPSNQTVSVGEPAIFTVAATATGATSYQWMKNGRAILGATQATYVTPASSPADSGSLFSVAIFNYLGQLTSAPASLTVSPASVAAISFVAPTGDDTQPGTMKLPYRTIQHCATAIPIDGTCQVRAGTYRETVVPKSNTTITAYAFERVVVDGSDPVTGWTLHSGSIYKATVPLRADDTNQVFVGANMMTEARWPNGYNLFNVDWAHAKHGTNPSLIVDASLPSLDWTGAKIHLWSGSDPFSHQTAIVTSSSRGRLGIDVGQTGTCPSICPAPDGLYYLFGTLRALDTDREWFYDPSSTTLFFFAPGGVNPNGIDVRAKRRPYAFDLRARTGVTLSNIAIFAATIITDAQSTHNTLDRIDARYVSQFTDLPKAADDPTGNAFSILRVHYYDSGIVIDGTGNTLKNSSISYSAGAGVALEGDENTVVNNLIQYVDYVGNYSSGIDLDGNGNIIRSNTINKTGRQAIHVSGSQNEDIGYNNLYNAMLLSRDGAEIYACCNQVASGTRIHHNWLHDTVPVIGGQGDSYALSGLAIDNGSSGFNVDQNIFWDNKIFNIIINGVSGTTPNNNRIVNNTIPDNSSLGQIGVVYVPSCLSTIVSDNRLVVDVSTVSNGSACTIANNSSKAPGAFEMSPTTQVGCNFAGCSTSRPPEIAPNGAVIPCPVD